MPELGGVATFVGKILPRVYRFTMHDDRIDYESDSYAVIEKGDPVTIRAKDAIAQALARDQAEPRS